MLAVKSVYCLAIVIFLSKSDLFADLSEEELEEKYDDRLCVTPH